MLGDGGVGKSTFVERLATGRFNNATKMTIGIDFQLIHLVLDDDKEEPIKVDVAVWDLGGESQFRFILPHYITGADGALLLFDLSRIRTIDNLSEWVSIWKQNTHKNTPLYLIGAKHDTLNEHFKPILDSNIQDLKTKLEISKHYLTSSKTGTMVNEVITSMAKDMLEFKSKIANSSI